MNIYIPTYRRVGRQTAFAALPPDLRQRVMFVCHPSETDELVHRYPDAMGFLPQTGEGVAAARQSAVEYEDGNDGLFFLDDDLHFSRRVPDWDFKTKPQALKMSHDDIRAAFAWAEQTLGEYPACGLAGRGGNVSQRKRWVDENFRLMRSFGVNRSALAAAEVRFDDFFYWEDFHVTLTLLEQGYPNLVSVDFLTDAATNLPGGVTRDVDRMWTEARRFVELHPTAVIKTKTFKHGENSLREVEYPDLSVKWKDAFNLRAEK